jgi:hypothetical protein
MKIEDQVCTLEQAKKLKELGVVQESFFCWIGDDNPDPKYNTPYKLYGTSHARGEVGASWYEHRIAAFTVAELGLMLPSFFGSYKIDAGNFITGKNWCEYLCQNFYGKTNSEKYGRDVSLTEANARAAMLINLIEMQGIRVEEINQRLTA